MRAALYGTRTTLLKSQPPHYKQFPPLRIGSPRPQTTLASASSQSISLRLAIIRRHVGRKARPHTASTHSRALTQCGGGSLAAWAGPLQLQRRDPEIYLRFPASARLSGPVRSPGEPFQAHPSHGHILPWTRMHRLPQIPGSPLSQRSIHAPVDLSVPSKEFERRDPGQYKR